MIVAHKKLKEIRNLDDKICEKINLKNIVKFKYE